MALRYFLRNNWPAVTITVTAVAMVIAAIVIFRSMPPRMIVMATGSEGGSFYDVGERYRAALASAGVKVRLVPTAGSAENLALLLDPHSGVSVGLVQGGTIGAEASSKLESLGTVFYEPLWLFYERGLGNNKGQIDLRGRRISAVGSGTRALSLELLKRNGVDGQNSELLALTTKESEEKLLAGEIDALGTVNAWEAPIVQKLITDEHIELYSFAARADAYVALYPFLNKVVVPRGVGDLAKDLPPTDVILFAPKVSLVVRKDLHPAIQYLLLDAAVRIHSRPGIFQHANQFPAAESIDLPLSSRGAAILQIWPAIPAQLSPVLGGGTGRHANLFAHSDFGRALPDDKISATPVRLADAIKDNTHIRRTEISGG